NATVVEDLGRGEAGGVIGEVKYLDLITVARGTLLRRLQVTQLKGVIDARVHQIRQVRAKLRGAACEAIAREQAEARIRMVAHLLGEPGDLDPHLLGDPRMAAECERDGGLAAAVTLGDVALGDT